MLLNFVFAWESGFYIPTPKGKEKAIYYVPNKPKLYEFIIIPEVCTYRINFNGLLVAGSNPAGPTFGTFSNAQLIF